MLSIAISTFFALAFFGAALVIAMMFSQYRDRIVSVIRYGMKADPGGPVVQPATYRRRTGKAPQFIAQNRALKTAPLRAAA